MAVENALSKIQGVESFSVSLKNGEALIVGNPDPNIVIDEINKLGYQAAPAT